MEYKSEQSAQPTSLLDSVTSRLFNLINSQEATISNIESKMHKILNRSTPSDAKLERNDREPSQIPFNERVDQEIMRLEINSNRLDKILKHLSEIV